MTRRIGISLLFASLTVACGKRGFEGVAECDAYFKAVDQCENTNEKGALESAANLEKEAWQYLGSDEVKKSCVERHDFVKDRCAVGPEGVAACDEYFKVVASCKEGPAKATQEKNAEQRKGDWKSMPKSQLEKTCKMNVDMAKKFCE